MQRIELGHYFFPNLPVNFTLRIFVWATQNEVFTSLILRRPPIRPTIKNFT